MLYAGIVRTDVFKTKQNKSAGGKINQEVIVYFVSATSPAMDSSRCLIVLILMGKEMPSGFLSLSPAAVFSL